MDYQSAYQMSDEELAALVREIKEKRDHAAFIAFILAHTPSL